MYLGVFWDEKSIAITLEILRAPELAATDDDEYNENHGMTLIDFITSSEYAAPDSALAPLSLPNFSRIQPRCFAFY